MVELQEEDQSIQVEHQVDPVAELLDVIQLVRVVDVVQLVKEMMVVTVGLVLDQPVPLIMELLVAVELA